MAGFTVRIAGEVELKNYFRKLENGIYEAENSTLMRVGDIAADIVRSKAPRSKLPRGANKKNDRQDWRTGEHAADHIRVTKPHYDESGEKIVEVGVPMDKKGRTPYFYLRIHEVGGMGGRIPAMGFFAMARTEAAAQIGEIAREELQKRMP